MKKSNNAACLHWLTDLCFLQLFSKFGLGQHSFPKNIVHRPEWPFTPDSVTHTFHISFRVFTAERLLHQVCICINAKVCLPHLWGLGSISWWSLGSGMVSDFVLLAPLCGADHSGDIWPRSALNSCQCGMRGGKDLSVLFSEWLPFLDPLLLRV